MQLNSLDKRHFTQTENCHRKHYVDMIWNPNKVLAFWFSFLLAQWKTGSLLERVISHATAVPLLLNAADKCGRRQQRPTQLWDAKPDPSTRMGQWPTPDTHTRLLPNTRSTKFSQRMFNQHFLCFMNKFSSCFAATALPRMLISSSQGHIL